MAQRAVLPFLAAVAALAVEVRAATTCPTGEEVARQLALIDSERAGSATPQSREVAEILRRDDAVVVRLLGPDGAVIAERALRPDSDCDERAQTAAVLIATWEARLDVERGGTALELPERPAPLRPATIVAAPPSPAAAAPWRPSLEAGAFVAFDGTGLAPALAATARLSRARWGFVTEILAVGAHDAAFLEVANASYVWRRLAAGVGPMFRHAGARWTLTAQTTVLGAVLDVRGRGFARNEAATSLDAGAAAGLQVARHFGAVAAWARLTGVRWMRPENVVVVGATDTDVLPGYELLMGVGGAWNADF